MSEDNIFDKLDIKDVSNIIDASREILSDELVDEYIRSLINSIAKVIFVNRPITFVNRPNKVKDDKEVGE